MLRKRIISFSFIPSHMDDDETYYGGFLVYHTFCDILKGLGYRVHRRVIFTVLQRLPEDYVYQMQQKVTQVLLGIPTCRDIVVLNKKSYPEIANNPYHYTILMVDEKEANRYVMEHSYSV